MFSRRITWNKATTYSTTSAQPYGLWWRERQRHRNLKENLFGQFYSRWYFQRFFIFTPTWGNNSIWLFLFRSVGSTTNIPPTSIGFVIFVGFLLGNGITNPGRYWCALNSLTTMDLEHLALPCSLISEGTRIRVKGRELSLENGREDPWQESLSTQARWWFQIFVVFTPNLGEMIQFDEHIFQMGWFNHQLARHSLEEAKLSNDFATSSEYWRHA